MVARMAPPIRISMFPVGFTSHSATPTPTDEAITFYYPRLGNLSEVTLVVFHVANFHLSTEGGRVRIGTIGGPGGSNPGYKHSHIEFSVATLACHQQRLVRNCE